MPKKISKVINLWDAQVQEIIRERKAVRDLKTHYETAADLLKSREQALIDQIESGTVALTVSLWDISVRVSHRRYPAWKDHFVAIAGAGEADRVLNETTPVTYRDLVIKERK